MKYYIIDQNLELMKNAFFYYRNNMNYNKDEIVAIIEDEFSTEDDIILAQKKLLELEGEYRANYKNWKIPPVKLTTVFLPKYSL